MPTNIPDPRKRKAQANEELLVYVMINVMVVGMVIACAIVGWSVAFGSKTSNPNLRSEWQSDIPSKTLVRAREKVSGGERER
jgi:hypothetical protein